MLWQKIKGKSLGVQFHRQVPMLHFMVDFYCYALQLAIEIDGYSHHNKQEYDAKRQAMLEEQGVRFLRFTDTAVKKDMQSVLAELHNVVKTHSQHSSSK
ncbi:endonuclease domain-containing protein [Wenyingzhuangia sp. IMCC45533]